MLNGLLFEYVSMGGINDNIVKIVASEFKIPHYNFFERVQLILVLFLFLIMSTDKMKGLLKGLRYISNIFEAEDKEPEMQIGFPTDVKHVAHIGWDDHSMNEIKSESGNRTVGERNGAGISPKSHSQDAQRNGEVHTSSTKDLPAVPLPKSSKRNPSSSRANPTSHRNQHSRRHQSSSTNSSDRDKSESSRRGRRERNIAAGEEVTQNETSSSSSALQDQSVVAPKQAHRRKAKGSSSSSGTSSRSSRSKEQQFPLPEPTREEEEEKEGG